MTTNILCVSTNLLILEVSINRIIQYLCFLCLARKCVFQGFEGGRRLGGNVNPWRQEGALVIH